MKKDIRMDEIKNKRILIVDDEYELLNMIKEMLLNEGFFQHSRGAELQGGAESGSKSEYSSVRFGREPS